MLFLWTAFFSLLAEAAHAEPISLAITGAVAGALGVTAPLAGSFAVAATTFGISTAASIALSYAAKALQPKPQAGQALTGLETQVQLGGDVPRQIAVGLTAVRGQLVFNNSFGTNNDILHQVYVLSDWPSDSLEAVWFNGTRFAVSGTAVGGGKTIYGVPALAGQVSIFFYDGTQTVADDFLVGFCNPPGRWDANSILQGMTYVIVAFQYVKDSPLYENGIPQLIYELRGARLYDPRADDTNGGSGPARWDDLSTYAFTDNPAIILYNYQRGFYSANGERILGMGVSPSDMLNTTYFAAMNACDEFVPLDAGGSEPRYRCSTILSADEGVTHEQTIDVLLSTFAGQLFDYAGSYYCQAGVGQTSVDTIVDRELVLDYPVTFSAKRSRADLVNRIHGQFLDQSLGGGFQPQSYNPQISDAGVESDMEELGRQLDLLSVPSQFQAERIAKIRLRENRAQATATITVGFNHIDKQVGDWVTWDSFRYGLRVWRIVDRRVDAATKAITWDLNEINAAVYSWSAAEEGVAPGDPVGLTVGNRISGVSGFTVQAVTLADGDGNQIPALKFGWTPITDGTVDAVVIEYRKVGTTVATRIMDPSVGDGVFQATDGVVGGIDYEARATITTTPTRLVTWTAWIGVRTSTAAFSVSITTDDPPLIPTGLAVTSEIVKLPDGTVTTLTHFVWNQVTSPNLATYELQVQEDVNTNPALIDPSKFLTLAVSVTPKFDYRGISPGSHIWARVKSVSKLDNASGYSNIVGHTVAANTAPPADPTGLTALASFQTVFLAWTQNTANVDFDHVTVYESTSNNRGSAVAIASTKGTTFIRTGLTPGSVRYYWIRAYNTSGVASVNFYPVSATAGISATTVAITTTDIQPGSITTPLMVANTIAGDRILTGSMDAAKIAAGSVLAGSVTVDGTALSTTTANVADPAARVNAGTTQIDPGKILVSGSTSLASWRNGADLTKINGGSIAANSITTNSLKVGSRGITVVGLDMQVISGTIQWGSGTISFVNDAGANTSASIPSGSASSAAVGSVIVWQKGSSNLTYASSWASAVSSYGADMVLMATFNGFGGLNVTYGGAIIDGARIKANTIQANNLSTGELITQSAQIGDAIILNAKIGNLEVGTLKIAGNAVTDGAISTGTLSGPGSVETELQYTTQGGPIHVILGFYSGSGAIYTGSPGSIFARSYAIRRDFAARKTVVAYDPVVSWNSATTMTYAIPPITISHVIQPVPGTYWFGFDYGGVTACDYSLMVREYKK